MKNVAEKPKISVVVPTYNRRADLKRCLDSLLNQSFQKFEIIVIDNGSNDGTSQLLRLYPVKILQNSTKNLFYLANLGLQHASSEIVAYTSDDCVVHQDWLKKIVKTFRSSENLGAVGGPAVAMRKQEITSMYDSSKKSIALKFLAKVYNAIVMENKFLRIGILCQSGAYTMGGSMSFSTKLRRPIYVDFLTITNMAVSKKAIEKIGGFDEGFPQHHGDADLSLRLKRNGYKLVFDPEAIVWHYPNPKGPSRNAYQIARDYASFYIRDIHPDGLAGRIRLLFNMLCFNLFWFYKTVQSRNLAFLNGILGFAHGFMHSFHCRNLEERKSSAYLAERLTSVMSGKEVSKENKVFSTSVVILNWNGKGYLKRCLDSIAEQTYKPSEVLLVDNGSNDGSASFVRNNFPWVKVLEVGKNMGSSQGHNMGIINTSGCYIAVLDNDLYLDKNWLKEEVQALSLTGVGIAGGVVKSYDPPHQQIFFPNRFFPSLKIPWAILSRRLSHKRIVETDTVQSCAMMIKREILNTVGILDPTFFFWNEDVDLCLRIKKASFKVVFNPNAVAYHRVGGLRTRTQRLASFIKANIQFAKKSYPIWQVPFAMLSIAIANIHFFALKKF